MHYKVTYPSDMTIKDRLRLIQRLSGQSQEKLAASLGVSFPTLNSWINERSLPRKQAQERIDALFCRLTGEKIIPSSVIEAKKQVIAARRQGHRSVLKEMMENKDIYDQFLLSLTFNTNRIEASTLTEAETAAILFENAALPNKSIIEHMEVKNHQAALLYLCKHIEQGVSITEGLIIKLHSILMNGIQSDAGSYLRHAVRIAGANVPTANYVRVPLLMKGTGREIQKRKGDGIAHAARIHSRFEQIHPFSDGNGRLGRLLLDAMLLEENLPPAVIRQEKRRFYILYLNKSQLQSEFSLLEDFICDGILDAFDLLERK